MKVLFVSNDPSLFDAGSATRARMRTYAKEIGELHIISRAPFRAKEEAEDGLFLHPFLGGRLAAYLFMPKVITALITTYGIQVVSAQDPFEHGVIALKGIKGTTARLHIQVHTDFLSKWFTRSGNFRSLRVRMPVLNTLRVRLADKVLPQAAGIRVVSLRIKDSIRARYGERVVEPVVIPVTVSGTLPEAVAFPPHSFSFAFITVGRLEPEKRIEDILMALGRLGPRFYTVGLFVVGEGRDRGALELLAKKLGLSHRVVFLGNRPDAWGLMQNAHALVQASAYEGYGRTLIEAALAKIPIITTDVGVVGEVFRGYEDVLATPPGDPANLAAHMTALLSDHQLRAKLVMNAEYVARAHVEAQENQPARIAEDLARLIV